jgi:excinuclease ABC subunit B
MKFKLTSDYSPTGDQPQAIEKLTAGLLDGRRDQTMLGVTGSGKTFTMANIVERIQKPTLVIAHNKTLAAQLAAEFREFFPDNAVHYFVSYYDYYQPESYVPRKDLYIEKVSSINEEIDRLRHAATRALLTREDVLIVASVSCIYGLGSPEDYQEISIKLKLGEERRRDKLLRHLTDIQYRRNDIDFSRGTFRVRGDVVEVYPAYEDKVLRVEFFGDLIERIVEVDSLTGEIIQEHKEISIFPAKHFITPSERLTGSVTKIRDELNKRIIWFKSRGMELEAQRIEQRTRYDLEMLETTGYCTGIENYSRFLSNREQGEQPATLLDYYPDDFLMFIDESHMTVPQIGGMYNGDRSRKQNLVEFGFRLPSALDNRPLKFEEFERHIRQVIYVSATPNEYELSRSTDGKVKTIAQLTELADSGEGGGEYLTNIPGIAEQVIRPTGLLDPVVEVRPSQGQIDDVLHEIRLRTERGQRALITTLTKKMAEDLADFLAESGVKVHYLHSGVDTLDRLDILRDLRLGVYDVVVGINLLREGLDLPEVSLVVILDADKEGFLRSETSMIQTIGRAARHLEGTVIMYADKVTGSMQRAMAETTRRRGIQEAYNQQHNITPRSIQKDIHELPRERKEELDIDFSKVPRDEVDRLIKDLESQMDLAARNLEFEKAATLRDQIKELHEAVPVRGAKR